MRNAVIKVMQDLYPDPDRARALLLSLDVPPWRIVNFRTAHTFWTDMVMELERGIIKEGLPRLIAAALAEFPDNAELAELARHSELEQPSGAIRVLCLFADPMQRTQLRLTCEERLIREIAERGRLHLETRTAVRDRDIIHAIALTKPQILHFAGHGGQNGLLVLEREEEGQLSLVRAPDFAAAIAAAIMDGADILQCVVLNSCFSADDAESFCGVTRLVVGSVTKLGDKAALAFTHGFYSSISDGGPPARAYQAGLAQMRLEGHPTDGMRAVSCEGHTLSSRS